MPKKNFTQMSSQRIKMSEQRKEAQIKKEYMWEGRETEISRESNYFRTNSDITKIQKNQSH